MNIYAKQLIDDFSYSNKNLIGVIHGFQSHRYATSNVSNKSEVSISQYGPSSLTTKTTLSTTPHSECEFWIKTSDGMEIFLKAKEAIPVADGQEYSINWSEAGSKTGITYVCSIEMVCQKTGRTIFLSGMGDRSLGYGVLLFKNFKSMNDHFSRNVQSVFDGTKDSAWSIYRKELPASIKIMNYVIPILILAGLVSSYKIFYILAAADFIYLLYNNKKNPMARELASYIAEKRGLIFSKLEAQAQRIER
jgi:hypothetical protein